ncbi:MAG: alpha/beta hydrolase [Solibacillus sp.]
MVHPIIKSVLDSIPVTDGPSPKINPEEFRAMHNQPVLPVEERTQLFAIEDKAITTSEAPLQVRIYTPNEAESYSVLMYFHGGAFISGTLESHDEIARDLCAASGYKVVAVDYRLAPEHPFPAAPQDCYDATKWVVDNKEELGWDGENLAFSGDSAGGNLVAAVTLLARDKQEFTVSKQVLFYPSIDLDFAEDKYPSLQQYAKGYFVESEMLPQLNDFYVAKEQAKNPLASPIFADTLEGLPEALIITAECDPLRDEAEAYAEKLKQAGVDVMLKRYNGVTHGFLAKWTQLEEYKDVYKVAGAFLKTAVYR